MKAILALSLALVASTSVQAQIFRPNAGRPDRSDGPRDRGHAPAVHPGYHHGGYYHRGGPSFYLGFGPAYYSPYYPAYSYYPGYGPDYPYYGNSGYYGSGSAAANGLVLGAVAGGIIGNNSGSLHHSGWRGAAWGAGIGWLLGSIADANRRPVPYATAPAVVYQPTATLTAPATAPASSAPQQVTIINNYYNSSPMSGANSLFGR